MLLHNSPHARRGRRIRDSLRPLPPTPIKNKLATQLSLTLRDPAGLLVRSPENLAAQLSSPLRESRGASRPFPRKTLSHNFRHRGCIPRGFSYVLVSVSQGPDDGSSQESFVLHRDQGTKQGTKQDSAPSGTQPPRFTLSLA